MRIKLLHIIPLFFISLVQVSLYGQTDLLVSNVNVVQIDKNLIIKYDLFASERTEQVFINMIPLLNNKDTLKAKSVSGDIYRYVQPGNDKTIIWNFKADYPNVSDSVSIEIIAEALNLESAGKILLQETLWPGYSTYKQKNKGYYLLIGGVAYSSLIASLYFENEAQRWHKKYSESMEELQRSDLYEKSIVNRQISNTLLVSTLSLFALNYGRVLISRKIEKSNFNRRNHYYIAIFPDIQHNNLSLNLVINF